jgi:hypothetical protein
MGFLGGLICGDQLGVNDRHSTKQNITESREMPDIEGRK